ncbi:hypothetical protein GGR51DRAFT_555123 [Nemania sp. FL0031]|nr:hypothetical protein GGR51DRAFT_555123 [Nemania sp. FL0031]
MDIPKIDRDAPITLGPQCPLLQSPTELILCIAEFLYPSDIVAFCQTCPAVRRILKGKYCIDSSKLSRTEQLRCLAALAKQKPQKWVCEDCTALHPMVESDTPASIFNESSCPRRSHRGWTDARLQFDQIKLEHRHIQLALKYTRLQKKGYNSYLKALLAPHINLEFAPLYNYLKTHYSAYPKIATASNGNLTFLLLSTWRYHSGPQKISCDNIGYLPICPHVAWNPWSKWDRGHPSHALQEAVRGAVLAQRGWEHIGACPRCATDFSVELSLDSQYLDLRVWQDFGPEGSPEDPAWQTHVARIYSNNWERGPTLYHELGSIRRLYEGDRKRGNQIILW